MNLIRKILVPFVPIYFLITYMRNYFYDKGWLISKSYDLPIICVGNLSVGGTGKTPLIEFFIRHYKCFKTVAVLSRGYKRQTKGYILADNSSTVNDIGDEPFQFYTKFKDIYVAVDSKRKNGIENLIEQVNPELVLLDDAFQHRQVKAAYTIVLTTYHNPFYSDMVLPTGNLREPRNGYKRAQAIIVTKCSKNLSSAEKTQIISNISPQINQKVFFSWISYSNLIISTTDKLPLNSLKDKKITLVTGIENPKPLLDYLVLQNINFEHQNYSDHHNFSQREINKINSNKFVLTTEKDYMRLQHLVNTKLYYLPIEIKIDREKELIEHVNSFIKK